jgi:hypothetical protein
MRRESVGVIRAFSRRCEAADVPAERSGANFFSCGKFDFVRLVVRVREPRCKLCKACARNNVMLRDVAETRIPRALLHCFQLFEKICAGHKKFRRRVWMWGALPMRQQGANLNLYTKLSGNAVFFSALV